MAYGAWVHGRQSDSGGATQGLAFFAWVALFVVQTQLVRAGNGAAPHDN
ncbi:hypothetical protein [Croceicoccus ponticola]|nr:hypothetical protein [Croceicoccus ponticola]